jgi:hypothetical protein
MMQCSLNLLNYTWVSKMREKSFHLLLLLATADFQDLNISEIAISHSPRSKLNLFAECAVGKDTLPPN